MRSGHFSKLVQKVPLSFTPFLTDTTPDETIGSPLNFLIFCSKLEFQKAQRVSLFNFFLDVRLFQIIFSSLKLCLLYIYSQIFF